MAIKKKQLGKGLHANCITLSRDGKYAAGHTAAGHGGSDLCIVELATGKERRITVEAPFTRIGAVDFLGPSLVVAALEDAEPHDDLPWSVLVIDPEGTSLVRAPAVTKGTVSGSLAVGPEGQVALVVSTALFLWNPGELDAGKAPRRLELEVDPYSSRHIAWTDAGELLVFASEKLVELSPALEARTLALPGIEPCQDLSCSANAVAFLGSRSEGPGFANAITFVVDRKTGAVTATLDSTFDAAHLGDGELLGASGGKTWLKKKGWKRATRTPELEQGYVMRMGLDGTPKEVVPMKLGRVDAFVSAGDVVLLGSDKGMTWYSGVFSKG